MAQTSHTMDSGTFATFKDALTGKKRYIKDIKDDIDKVKVNTSLTPIERAHQLGNLYGELRNKYRGKDEYENYNKLMSNHYEVAKELEQQELMINQQLKEKTKRDEEERNLKIKLEKTTANQSLSSLAKCDARMSYLAQLKALFDGVNKEKYNLYDASYANAEQKKSLLVLKASLDTTTDKSKKAETLRAISKLCTKEARAQRYLNQAQAVEQEIRQEELAAKYKDIQQTISETTSSSERAKLYRVLSYYSDEHAAENLALAKHYEEQADREQQQQLFIVDRTCKIVGLNMEIEKTAADSKLTPYQRTSTLANLFEERFKLAQDVPKYQAEFINDIPRVQKLRREAISHATNEADRQAVIKLLTY